MFQLSDPNIIATSIEPDGGHYKIRMFNVSDKNVSCRVLWNSIKPEKIKVFYDGVSYETKNANEAIEFPALGIIEIETE